MRVLLAAWCASLCVLAGSWAHAVSAATVAAGRNADFGDQMEQWFGIEFGPTFSLPVPAADASRDQSGLGAGFRATAMVSRYAGLGADIVYHYWPVSAEFKDEFNRYLSWGTLNTLRLGGETWAMSAVQYTAHVKVAAPTEWVTSPWVRVGGGYYQVDPRTTGYTGDAGFFWISAPPLKRKTFDGYFVEAGLDVRVGPRTRLGFVGTHDVVQCKDTFGSDLHLTSLGIELLFGR